MLRDSNTLKDVLLASAIILVLVASRAEGQVRAALLTRSVPPDAEGAIMALEESREALLEARDAIDAALRRVDQTLASLGEARPRERALARSPEPVPARLPSLDDFQALWRSAVAFSSGFVDRLSPWRHRLVGGSVDPARVESGPLTASPAGGIAGGGEPRASSAPDLEAAALTGAAQSTAPEIHDPARVVHDPARAIHDPARVVHDPARAIHDPARAPSIGPPVEQEIPGRILDAAGAILRALDDAAARARQVPGPESPPPPAGRADAVPVEADRAGVRGDR